MKTYRTANTKKQLQKEKKRRRKIILGLKCAAGVALILVLCSFLSGLSFGNGKRLADYVSADEADLIVPAHYEGDEIRQMLQQMATEDEQYQKICDQYEQYPQDLLAALCSNPEMISYVSNYLESDKKAHGGLTQEEIEADVPLLMQWDERWGYANYGDSSIALSGCAPTCLSMVIVGLTGNEAATPDAIAEYAVASGYYINGTGTAWAIMTEGCQNYAVTGMQIPLDEDTICRHLESGEPIIASMAPGDFTTAGHFIVLTECIDGKYLVHDPNSRARSKVLWSYETLASQIKNLWAFQAM